MPKLRMHYDNLKVSRDAPIEVIQAAYRSLARKYHPDRNGSTKEGDAVMKIINASYEVLSDPVRRAKHDQWIADQMRKQRSPLDWRQDGDVRSQGETRRAGGQDNGRGRPARRGLDVTTVLLAVCFFGVAIFMIRVPGLRLVGIGMMVAGWIYLQTRKW